MNGEGLDCGKEFGAGRGIEGLSAGGGTERQPLADNQEQGGSGFELHLAGRGLGEDVAQEVHQVAVVVGGLF